MQNLIFEGGAPAAGYDPDETQSQDGRGAFTPAAGYDPDQAAFMRDQVGMDLYGFQTFGFVSTGSFMSARSFCLTKCEHARVGVHFEEMEGDPTRVQQVLCHS